MGCESTGGWRRGRGILCLAGCVAGRALAANVPVSLAPPGGLAPADTPQMVLLTFDDSVSTASYEIVRQVLTNRFNPNGHPIKATFFVSLDSRFDFARVQRLYADGHEIAIHTMSHATSATTTVGRWNREIAGDRRTLAALAAIPAAEIVGFRAPFLQVNDAAFQMLEARGFRYDSSFAEYASGPAAPIWPYTLDNGLQQAAPPERLPARPYPGLFELPLYAHFSNGTAVTAMDPPETYDADAVQALWRTNFTARYTGNRAPFTLALHTTTTNQWLSHPLHSPWRVEALTNFIAWALAHSNTWFVTCRDVVDFMEQPVPADAAHTSAPFMTRTNAYFPTGQLSRCTFPGSHTFHVCGAAPPAAPTYANAWLGLVPDDAGVIDVYLASQDVTYAYGRLVVSNDAGRTLNDWQAAFSVAGGAVNQMFDGLWTNRDGRVEVDARQYNATLTNGAAYVIAFRVLRDGGDVQFSDLWLQTYSLGPRPSETHVCAADTPGRLCLTWSDTAPSYALTWATNAPAGAWTNRLEPLYRTTVTVETAAADAPVLFRVEGQHD